LGTLTTRVRQIRFRLLGPVEAWRDGTRLAIGGPKQRAVLAVLLLNANRVVPISQLIDHIWGDRAPDRAVNTVQVYVSSLRRVLEPHPPVDAAQRLLATRGPGYRLTADERSLDLLEFLAIAAEGRRRLDQSHYAEASERLNHALGLFRGPPLADLVDEPFAQAELAAIGESRLAALEARIEADLACGRESDVTAELHTLVAQHPWHERFRGLLAESLYRAGRQADALAVFRDARAVLADELGIDPSPELLALEQAILHQAQLDRVRRRGRPLLLLHDGAGGQRVVPLDAAQSPLTIGRRSTNDICLGWDPEVSRLHAQLEYQDGSWDLTDEGLSRNGSFVDGELVRGRRQLSDAQVIRLGGTVLLYRSGGGASLPSAPGSAVTSTARVRSASQLEPSELALLRALAAGAAVAGNSAELDSLRRRFDVQNLPPGERDVVLLQRARAVRAIPGP
jgi:DNA-binding SARP family transcriptional activator